MENLTPKQTTIIEELQQYYHVYFTNAGVTLESKVVLTWDQAELFLKDHYGFELDDIDVDEGI